MIQPKLNFKVIIWILIGIAFALLVPTVFAGECDVNNVPSYFHRYVCVPIPPSNIPVGHAIQDGCIPLYPQSTWKGQFAEMEFVATRPAMKNACEAGQLQLKTPCIPTQQEVDWIMVMCPRKSGFYKKWFHEFNEGGRKNNPIVVTDQTSVRNAINYRSMVLADKKEWIQGEFTFNNIFGWTTYVNNMRTIPLPPVDTSIKYPQLPGPVPLEVRANPIAQRITIHPDSWHEKACWYFTRGLFTQDTLIWIDLPECTTFDPAIEPPIDPPIDPPIEPPIDPPIECEDTTIICDNTPILNELIEMETRLQIRLDELESEMLRKMRGEHFILLQNCTQ